MIATSKDLAAHLPQLILSAELADKSCAQQFTKSAVFLKLGCDCMRAFTPVELLTAVAITLVSLLTNGCATTYKPVIFNHDPFVEKVIDCAERVKDTHEWVTRTAAWNTCDKTERDKQAFFNGIIQAVAFTVIGMLSASLYNKFSSKNDLNQSSGLCHTIDGGRNWKCDR